MRPAQYCAHYPHNAKTPPAHYPHNAKVAGSLKARADAVLRVANAMCECAAPRSAQSHITPSEPHITAHITRTLPAQGQMEAALELALSLQDRGIELEARGDLLIARPAALLTEADKAAIKRHKPALMRIVTSDYSGLPDGWQICPAWPARLLMIKAGHLYDSITCPTPEDAQALLAHLLATETRRKRDREPT